MLHKLSQSSSHLDQAENDKLKLKTSIVNSTVLSSIITSTNRNCNKQHRILTERLIAPGKPSKKAGQPQPESNFVEDL
jgi:hypothetical protein